MKTSKYIMLLYLVISAAAFAVDEIHIDYETGATVYAARFQPNGDVFITSGLSDEIWATVGNYDVTMTENGTGGHFVGNFDTSANIGDGSYKITVYEQLGGSPADADRAIYVGSIKWKDGAEDRDASASDSAVTDALITSKHSDTDGKIDATDAELAKVPKSDSNVTWNVTALASINAEVDTALVDYDGPTKGEMDTAHALLATEAKQDIIGGGVGAILVLTTWAQDVLEGDVWIDTAPTPWQVVTTVKEAGGGVGGAERIRKDLKTINDVDVTSSNQRIDRTVEP
ncbi:MAG TPA: hypothetical protein ENH94_04260 [Phycisphaerales bacterium]|nr:hypothetical protein [Phycisphaerales bacterium]